MGVRVLLLSAAVILYMGIASGPIWAEGAPERVLFAQEKGGSDSPAETEDLFKELDKELGEGAGSDEDLFKDLDMELGEPSEPERAREIVKPSFIKDLADGFEGTFIPRVMFQLVNFEGQPGEDRDAKDVFYDYRLEGETKVAREKYIFNVAGWAEGGNQEGTYSRATQFMRDNEHRRRHLEINELYVTVTSENFDITLGRKIVQMGLSTLYTPTDRISPRDLNDPLEPKTYGVWLGSVDYYQKETTFTVAVFPFFSPNKTPDRTSIWTGKSSEGSTATPDYDFDEDEIESGVSIEEAFPHPWEVQGLLKAKTVFKGWDLFIAAFRGFSPLPVLKEMGSGDNKQYVKEYPRVGNYSGGFSTTYKKFEFHGEGLFQQSYRGRDDEYLGYAAGFTYTEYDLAHKIGHDRIDITVEYGGEWIAAAQSSPRYKRSSEDSRPTRNNGLGRVQFKYNEDLKWEYGINYEISDEGWSQGVRLEYNWTDDVIIKVSAEFFDGGNESYFERWEDNDRLICQLEYSF